MKTIIQLLSVSSLVLITILWTGCSSAAKKAAFEQENQPAMVTTETTIVTTQAKPQQPPQNLGATTSGRSR